MYAHRMAIPMREHHDPQALRAMAHPIRLKLLEQLLFHGPATATELADRIAESAPNCSWHLRQLAKYGYVEDVPGEHGRQRPYRAVLQGNSWARSGESPELALAGDAMSQVLVDREAAELRDWMRRRTTESEQWQDATFLTQSITWLTAEELDAIGQEIKDIVLRHMERVADPASRPDGARPVRMLAWGIPAN